METANIGIVGLGVMGQNLALNIAGKGYSVAVYNRTSAKTDAFISALGKDKAVIGTYSYEELTENLEKPRKILLMVKAGSVIDAILEALDIKNLPIFVVGMRKMICHCSNLLKIVSHQVRLTKE